LPHTHSFLLLALGARTVEERQYRGDGMGVGAIFPAFSRDRTSLLEITRKFNPRECRTNTPLQNRTNGTKASTPPKLQMEPGKWRDLGRGQIKVQKFQITPPPQGLISAEATPCGHFTHSTNYVKQNNALGPPGRQRQVDHLNLIPQDS